jgi:hypothetical protein
MGLFTKDIKSMDDLFLHVLQDIYYAENQIIKTLPDMIEKATNRELTAAFKAHLGETEKQVARLDQAFQLLGKEPKGTKCPAINGIIDEALLVESSQGVPVDSFPRAHAFVESQIEHRQNSCVNLLGVDVHGHLDGSCDAQRRA